MLSLGSLRVLLDCDMRGDVWGQTTRSGFVGPLTSSLMSSRSTASIGMSRSVRFTGWSGRRALRNLLTLHLLAWL